MALVLSVGWHGVRRVRAAAFAVGAGAPALIWTQVQAQGSSFSFQPAERYAALASVDTAGSLETIRGKLTGKGLDVTYLWQQGQASRGLYCVDDWLASLKPDPTGGERWVYIEANVSAAAPVVVDVDFSVLFRHIYNLAAVFQAVAAGSAPDAFPCASGHDVPPPPPVVSKAPPGGSPGLGLAIGGGLALLVLARSR